MAEHHGNRYGRSEQAREAVLRAADDMLVEVGFSAMTIEGLARRAGVAKQTIYRSWSGVTDVLLDVVTRDAELGLQFPDTGALASDLFAMLIALADFLSHNDAGRVLVALRAQAQVDPAFGPVFEQRFFAGQRARESLPFRRAIERGELPAGTDVERERLLLVGPLYAAAEEGALDGGLAGATLAAWRARQAEDRAT